MGAGAAGSLTGAAELFRFWVFPDCTFLDISTPYRVIMCKCRKRDVDAFLAAIRELPNKMLLCGYPDYLTFCADLKKNVQTVRDNGGVLTNETDDTTQEAEQESAKGATCEAAR